MTKKHSLFILLIFFQFCFCQENTLVKDTIALNEVLITKGNSRKEVIKIIEKIKKNLRENYETRYVNYITNHFSLCNNSDTLVNRKMLNILKIKALNTRNLIWMFNNDPTNPFHRETYAYSRFEPSNSENHPFALSIFYDSLKVIDFDFFDINKHYIYKISRDENITTIKFSASRYYSGYFSFNNTNYNLIRIAFKNTNPYDYYVNGYSRIIDYYLEFSSIWTYNNVTVLLDFSETDKGKLLLTKLDAMQEITKFKYTRFDFPDKVIDQGRNIKFYTTLNMRILE